MNGLAERRHTDQTLEQRAAYIKGLCDKATASGLGGGHSGKQIFDVLDYTRLAKYAGNEPIPFFDKDTESWALLNGEALTSGEISNAITAAVDEQTPWRKKGGLAIGLVTTSHILFQFYLIKEILHKVAQ